MILYFSGTGNSRYIAEGIQSVISDEIISLNINMKKNTPQIFESETPYVFVLPIYAWRTPRVVEEYIRKCEFKGSNEAYVIVSCESEAGNAIKYIHETCTQKGLKLLGYDTVEMPENYVAMFPVPDKLKAEEMILNSREKILSIANKIKDKKTFYKKTKLRGILLSSVINPLFYKIFVKTKGFKTDTDCTGCEICVNACPLNNIKLIDNKPVWDSNCTHCMACICSCPEENINYKNNTQSKPRYYNHLHF